MDGLNIQLVNHMHDSPQGATRYVLLPMTDLFEYHLPRDLDFSAVDSFIEPVSISQHFFGREYEGNFEGHPWRGGTEYACALVFEKHVAKAGSHEPATTEKYLTVMVLETRSREARALAIASDKHPLERSGPHHRPLLVQWALDSKPFAKEAASTFSFIQSGDNPALRPAEWLSIEFSRKRWSTSALMVDIGMSPDDSARESEFRSLAATMAEGRRRRCARFGTGMSEMMKAKGFDPDRFNIAVIGTNNTGKSTMANMVFFGAHNESRFKQFVSLAKENIAPHDKTRADEFQDLAQDQKEMLLSLMSGYALHSAKDGRATTFDMNNSKDLSTWFPNSVLWDLPGLEVSDGGVEKWAAKVSLNYFDAAIVVCEKQFSEDDFWLFQHLQQAIVNGAHRSIPMFLVRSKMDYAIVGEFEEYVDKGGLGREWDFNWSALSAKLRQDMLEGLEKANKQFAEEDAMLVMSTEACLSTGNFYFLGKSDKVESAGYVDQKIPFTIAEQVHRIFENQAALIRRRLLPLAQHKAMRINGTLGLCAFAELEAAVMCLEVPFDPPDFDEIDLRIDTGSPAQLGFGIKKQRMDYLIKAPEDDDEPDKRAVYGIQEDDFLLEFPIGEPVSKLGKKPDLSKKLNEVGKKVFHILIGRARAENDFSCWRNSVFRQLVHGSFGEVMEDEYNLSQEAIVRIYGKKHGASMESIRRLVKQIRDARPQGAGITLEMKAISDWASAYTLSNKGRGGEVEYCTMLNDATRCDENPAVTHAYTVLCAMKAELVVDREAPESSARLLAKIPKCFKNIHGRVWLETVFRGISIPGDKVDDVFFIGNKYRVPFFLATSCKEYVADQFARRSKKKSPAHKMAIFRIDVSEMPLHAAFVKAAPPNPQEEYEFLFVPYSCFEVTSISYTTGTYSICLKAFPCNKDIPGGPMENSSSWPLIDWH